VTDPEHFDDRIKLYALQASYELKVGGAETKKQAAAGSQAKERELRCLAATKMTEYMQTLLANNAKAAVGRLAPASAPLFPLASAAIALERASLASVTRAAGLVDRGSSLQVGESPSSAMSAFTADVREAGASLARSVRGAATLARVPMLQAEAVVAWHEGDFAKAREKYAECILKAPGCGPGPRLGLALCLYKLGHIGAAKMAAKRALQLESTCASALALWSFLEMNGRAISLAAGVGDAESTAGSDAAAAATREGARLARKAVQLAPECGAAVIELAQHTFNTWSEVIAPSSVVPITVSVLRGARTLVLSEGSADLLSRFRAGETVKVLVRVKGAPILVPLRLAAREHVLLARASALGPHAPAGAAPDALLAVLTVRSPWGLPSGTALPLRAIDLDASVKQARSATALARTDGARADAYYSLGRALHSRGEVVDANIAYRNALKFEPAHPAALTCLAQTEAVKGPGPGEEEAAKLLTRVLELRPDDRTALKLLAALCLKQKRLGEAADFARRAAELAPWDAGAAALFTAVAQRADGREAVDRALRSAENTAKRLRDSGNAVPPALLNNMGVLNYRLAALLGGAPAERKAALGRAEDLYGRALSQLASEAAPGASADECAAPAARAAAMLVPGAATSATFNIARLREAQGRGDEAVAIYTQLAASAPTYLDAQLQLAACAAAAGDEAGAEGWYESVVSKGEAAVAATPSAAAVGSGTRSAIVTALLSLGRIAEARGDRASARGRYARALTQAGFEKDPFASIALANLDFSKLYDLPPSSDAREGVLRDAFDRFKEVMKRHPANAYAANGLGCVLAEQGRLEHSREVFAKVREAAPGAMPATLNLAHAQTALGSTDVAAQLYGHVLRRFGGGRGSAAGVTVGGVASAAAPAGSSSGGGSAADQARLLQQLARAHVHSKRYSASLLPLARAVALCPTDLPASYNLAVVQMQEGFKVMERYFNQTQPGPGLPVVALGSRLVAADVERARGHLKAGYAGFKAVSAALMELKEHVIAAEVAVAAATGGEGAAAAAEALAAAKAALAALSFDPSPSPDVYIAILDKEGHLLRAETYLNHARSEAARHAADAVRRATELASRAADRAAGVAAANGVVEARKMVERAAAEQLQADVAAKQAAWESADAAVAAGKAKGKRKLDSEKLGDEDSDSDASAGGAGGRKKSVLSALDMEGQLKELFGGDSEDEGWVDYKPPPGEAAAVDSSGSSSDSSSSSDSEDSATGSESESGSESGKKGKAGAGGKRGKKKGGAPMEPARKKLKRVEGEGEEGAGDAPPDADELFDELFGEEEAAPAPPAGRKRPLIEDED
jgi:tetratricopeptide (TPR) repeat protein